MILVRRGRRKSPCCFVLFLCLKVEENPFRCGVVEINGCTVVYCLYVVCFFFFTFTTLARSSLTHAHRQQTAEAHRYTHPQTNALKHTHSPVVLESGLAALFWSIIVEYLIRLFYSPSHYPSHNGAPARTLQRVTGCGRSFTHSSYLHRTRSLH